MFDTPPNIDIVLKAKETIQKKSIIQIIEKKVSHTHIILGIQEEHQLNTKTQQLGKNITCPVSVF